ncbi:MAG: response regulator [Chitinophagales bacterium]|nr:response regulator [Chitinophagales bacterium]
MSYSKDRPVEILLIEDNSGDVLLTKEAFEELQFSDNITVARDGEDALDYLFKRGPYGNAVRPDLILLDLNLPKKDGREVLEMVKNDPDLKSIPVIVLTTSKSEKDIKMCYDLHCNCYITKPVYFEEFLEIVKFIIDFWIKLVKLPSL